MTDLTTIGVATMLAGFIVILLAGLLSSRRASSDGEERRTEVKGGGVILIGPIPIIFGSDAKWASVAIALAIILVLASFVLMQGWA